MIYIVTHKPVSLPPMEGYRKIQAGAALHDEITDCLRDDSGDNISSKNPFYCELTAIYWVWKNCDDDVKGLTHYRRFWGRSAFASKPSDAYSSSELQKMLNGVDVVLPNVEFLKESVWEELLVQCVPSADILTRLRDVVLRQNPDYAEAFDAIFSSNRLTLFNMMLCRRDLFDSYCQWLFPILFELEESVDMNGWSDFQKRLYGFLSERLLNVWVRHEQLRVRHLPVIQTEVSFLQKANQARRRVTNRIRFFLRKAVKAA